jgi:hypothetical protein
MKTYTVLYAEDVPIYGSAEFEAETDEAALELAREIHEDGKVIFDDIFWNASVCHRIVHIEDEDGNEIGHDISLDGYFLRDGGEPAKLLFGAAQDILKALRLANNPHWVANAGITNDNEALRRICLYHADWWNGVAWPAIVKACGGDEDAALRLLQEDTEPEQSAFLDILDAESADISNETRAERARETLRQYVEAKGEAFESSSSEIADLIADLLHLAAGLDEDDDDSVERALRLARMHYEAEVAEEGGAA